MITTAALAPEFTIDQALAEANSEGFVGAGTAHTEDHGTLKMIVARRHSRSGI